MNLKIDGSADVRPQRDHRRIEAFSVPNLKNCTAVPGDGYHCVSFVDSPGDRLFNQDMYARIQQPASNLCVRFSRNGQANSLNIANQATPIGTQRDVVLAGDFMAARLIDFADADKL